MAQNKKVTELLVDLFCDESIDFKSILKNLAKECPNDVARAYEEFKNPALDERIDSLLLLGRKMDAIKRHRELFGSDLREAVAYCDKRLEILKG